MSELISTKTSVNYMGAVMGAVMGVVITGIYGVPIGIMLKYLRGPKVKNTINGTAT